MKIPKQIKIGAHTIKVVEDSSLNIFGEYIYDANVIKIKKSLPQSLKESTLIHEIFHAINPTLGDSMLGHALLDSLAEQFYQVFRDNKFLK